MQAKNEKNSELEVYPTNKQTSKQANKQSTKKKGSIANVFF